MSADNGIYIHKFKDGFKVIHAQSIDNIYWKRGKNKYNYRILKNYFKDAKLFKTEKEALKYAYKLYHKIETSFGFIEYGISEV